MDIDEKYIQKVQEQEINGPALLLLTEEKLTRKPGPFEFPYGPAIVITKLIYALKGEEKIWQIVHCPIKPASDKKEIKSTLKWTIEERFILLEAVLEHLPNTLPWSEIGKKFEGRFPRRTNNGFRNQWSRRKEKGLVALLLKNQD
ncbi:17893_t:CDS:2 [Racocetra fulgida]|uniref:17893_t:CDS:1 n=1 Tax=Racocetra fulgida TaxID=60492 RepID=A0A9N9DHB5_9GLOM|nr:17893_t:CDS:2 [Racocetra fulgida]